MEGRIPPNARVKRWDGRARACAAWDSLRRDPELWFDNGNCFVHLYGKAQSRRGPAFRVSLRSLLAAHCHPLLNRYRSRDLTQPGSTGPASDLSNAAVKERIDIYIPPPPRADKKQALDFYLAIRNLLAWVYRRPMVGQHLGSALIALMNSMREFRSPGVDNAGDITSYLEDEGYLDMANQPIHALALVHLSEYYQLRDLYIDAFAHCAGMGDCLYALPEYQAVSSITRKLLRRAQAGVEDKLSKAAMSLRNFLEDDLSESNLGLTAGGRAHLERFRTFLMAFYTVRLGYFPPEPVHTRSGMWDPEIYRVMRIDFEALYEYLVDRAFTMTDSASFLSKGGICALYSVHTFDLRHKYTPLPHPVPLLPEMTSSRSSKRLSWFNKDESKLRPDRRLLAHAALVKATNGARASATQNPLVAAYKRFEEDSLCSQVKFDKIEKLSQADARKIRWLLIYGTYQTLRGCTEAPPEVRDSSRAASYSLAVSTADLPPWKVEKPRRPSLLRTRSRTSTSSPVASAPSSRASTPAAAVGGETRRDGDYFAFADGGDAAQPKRQTMPPGTEMPPIPPRSGSLTSAFSATGRRRQSLASVRGFAPPPPLGLGSPKPGRATTATATATIPYHELLARESVAESAGRPDTAPQRECTANRSPSTASSSSAGSSGTSGTNASDAGPPRSEVSWASVDTSIPDADADVDMRGKTMPTTTTTTDDAAPPPVRRRSSVRSDHSAASSVYSTPDEAGDGEGEEEGAKDKMCPPVPVRSRARDKSAAASCGEGEILPLQTRSHETLVDGEDEADAWRAIEHGVDARCEAVAAGQMVMTG